SPCRRACYSLCSHLARVTLIITPLLLPLLFFFPDPATTDIYTLSLHDALPILRHRKETLSLDTERLPMPVTVAVRGLHTVSPSEIGRAHVRTPVTFRSRMPSSA